MTEWRSRHRYHSTTFSTSFFDIFYGFVTTLISLKQYRAKTFWRRSRLAMEDQKMESFECITTPTKHLDCWLVLHYTKIGRAKFYETHQSRQKCFLKNLRNKTSKPCNVAMYSGDLPCKCFTNITAWKKFGYFDVLLFKYKETKRHMKIVVRTYIN